MASCRERHIPLNNSVYRFQEYKVFFYRLFLVYVFYFIARILFLIYNFDLLHVASIAEFLKIQYHGLAFDTTAILYVNSLFMLLSFLPFFINTKRGYQKLLFYVYFITNLIAYAINFVDLIYYKYTFSRTTIVVLDVLKHEKDGGSMFFRFLIDYWHVFLLFGLSAALWIYLYKKVKVITVERPKLTTKNGLIYVVLSLVIFCGVSVLTIGGIRGGDFKKSTRPINLVDANRHVQKIEQADLVLNSPFAFIRTINANSFKKVAYKMEQEVVDNYAQPIKQYSNNSKSKPNIVLIITESLGREYLGAFNKSYDIPNYKGYTPFLDSLAGKSLIFPNAYANGSKSIHGMSSVLSGIPSFKDAFTSSAYSKQDIQSLVSILNEEGYYSTFFHGAARGSMGFLGFSNILGFDSYLGREDYNNDDDFDGSWGIWDEPFLQYMKDEINDMQTPFFATVFTVSSHEPYVIPEKYEGKFPVGNVPMHKTVGYTDFAFKRFFEEAKKEEWFDNTIFILTADHSNQVFYKDMYYKPMNRHTVPILIYKPDNSMAGVNMDLAQQIDIYPTILDMIGYQKPFRSWGRSLVDTSFSTIPFAVNYSNSYYRFQMGNYICIFDGVKATGFYDILDKGLEKNLIENKNSEMSKIEAICKAYIKDYYDRIIDKKLSAIE
ncbi:LTA synthase family protein [Winogradskyella helgolandensis]|uniref:LTA synthase family protein n=1 Tax=Winogradskyella helgolandensis TaxID=2697010 RepID=UPI0015C6AED6